MRLLLVCLALVPSSGLVLRRGGLRGPDTDAANDPNVVKATLAMKNAVDDKPGWHVTVNPGEDNGPEENDETEAIVDRVCSGHAAMCRRYIYLTHGCFKECEADFQAFYDAKTSKRPGGRMQVAHWKHRRKDTAKAWEMCMAKCVPAPSCAKMCTHGSETCEGHCLGEYRKQAHAFEALYFEEEDDTEKDESD